MASEHLPGSERPRGESTTDQELQRQAELDMPAGKLPTRVLRELGEEEGRRRVQALVDEPQLLITWCRTSAGELEGGESWEGMFRSKPGVLWQTAAMYVLTTLGPEPERQAATQAALDREREAELAAEGYEDEEVL